MNAQKRTVGDAQPPEQTTVGVNASEGSMPPPQNEIQRVGVISESMRKQVDEIVAESRQRERVSSPSGAGLADAKDAEERAARRRLMPEEPPTPLSAPWNQRLLVDKDRYVLRTDPNVTVLRVNETLIATKHEDQQVHRLMAEIADQRGWEAAKVTGSEAFKREVWTTATERGMRIEGYKPSELDYQELRLRMGQRADGPDALEADRRALRNLDATTIAQRNLGQRDAAVAIAAMKAHLKDVVGDRQDRVAVEAALRERLTERRADAVRPIRIRDYQGELIAHGTAPYEFQKANKASYYVKLRDADGERTLWGKELETAVATNKLAVGEQVRLHVKGSAPVMVDVEKRSQTGKVLGTKLQQAHRNAWIGERLAPKPEEVTQQRTVPVQSRSRTRRS